jgi:hypothetical protein
VPRSHALRGRPSSPPLLGRFLCRLVANFSSGYRAAAVKGQRNKTNADPSRPARIEAIEAPDNCGLRCRVRALFGGLGLLRSAWLGASRLERLAVPDQAAPDRPSRMHLPSTHTRPRLGPDPPEFAAQHHPGWNVWVTFALSRRHRQYRLRLGLVAVLGTFTPVFLDLPVNARRRRICGRPLGSKL